MSFGIHRSEEGLEVVLGYHTDLLCEDDSSHAICEELALELSSPTY